MQNKLLGDSSIEYFFLKRHKPLCIIEIYEKCSECFFRSLTVKTKTKILHPSFTVLKTINGIIKINLY